ncbi:hypothetical protein FRC03_010336 [Tulasnella sp. 419]|nr:hypothetical protein FRC03_010336 [Tulasnella sp. 419]
MNVTRVPLTHPAFLDFQNRRNNNWLRTIRTQPDHVIELGMNVIRLWAWPLFMDAFRRTNLLVPVPVQYLDEYCRFTGIHTPHCLCGIPSRIEKLIQNDTGELEIVACCKGDVCGYLGKCHGCAMHKVAGLTFLLLIVFLERIFRRDRFLREDYLSNGQINQRIGFQREASIESTDYDSILSSDTSSVSSRSDSILSSNSDHSDTARDDDEKRYEHCDSCSQSGMKEIMDNTHFKCKGYVIDLTNEI